MAWVAAILTKKNYQAVQTMIHELETRKTVDAVRTKKISSCFETMIQAR